MGYIQKPHGIHGELVIRLEEEYYETLEECPTLFLEIDDLLVPYFISEEGLRFKSGESVIAKLDWVDTDKKAKDLCGLSVYAAQEDVVLSEDEFSPHLLTGFTLFDVTLGLIGQIADVHDYSGNLLLEVNYQGKETLIPLNEDLIVRLDEEAKEIELAIPDGIFTLDDE